jgi:hypothetical protein
VKELVQGVQPSKIVPADPQRIADALVEILRMGKRSNGSTRAGDLSERSTTGQVLALYQDIMAARFSSMP